MSIRKSATADITRLLTELSSGDSHRRELAGARLAVIGPRATTGLLAVVSDAAGDTTARVAALEALVSIGDARATAVALSLSTDAGDDALALPAIDLLGVVARGTDTRATKAFDRLSALAVDPTVPTTRRLASLAALEGQPERLLRPLYEALAKDPASRIVARVTRHQAGALESLEAMVAQGLPSDPALAAAVVRDDGERTRLTTLKEAIEIIRARERSAPPDERARWATVRGAVHHQLAARNSRLGLYDLRESLEAAHGPLPVGFLSAAAAIGDVACLVPLAQAWTLADADDRWWREHLADAFRSIVTREGLTRRHATLQKILGRWPAAAVLVAMAKK